MASQVITLPASLFHFVTGAAWVAMAQTFGLRGICMLTQREEEGRPVIRIIGRPDAVSGNPFVESTCLLMIHGGDAPSGYAPPILPEALAVEILEKTKVALLSLTRLTAHDQMVIIEAFEKAREAAPVPRQLRTHLPRSPYEAGLLARASSIQGIMAPAFSQLARKLACYRRSLRAGDFEVAVSRLDLQAELGALLVLEAGDDRFTPDLKGASRRGNLRSLAKCSHNALEVFQDIAEQIHRSDVADTHWLDPEELDLLHRRLLAGMPASQQAGKLRRGPAATRSPFRDDVREVGTPADKLREAVEAFTNAFDLALWRDVHPVIRAAMAHTELVRLHPYTDGNGRLARQVLQGMLLEAGLPVLPLLTVFEWNRHNYLHHVDRAVTHGEELQWARFLLKAVHQAIRLGTIWSRPVRNEVAAFEAALRPQKDLVRYIGRIAVMATTSLLGPDPQVKRWSPQDVFFEHYAKSSLLCDMVDILDLDIGGMIADRQSPTLWSHPLARFLLAHPPARL